MRYKQIRFSPSDYTPRIHGYCRVSHKGQFDKGNSIQDQETRIKQYVELRKSDSNDEAFQKAEFYRFWTEPRAKSAYTRELRQRPVGAKLWDNLKPGDYIIVDKLDRMFRNTMDFLACQRHFAESGVRLHFVNLMGISVDTGSSGGGMVLHMLAFLAEMESDRIGERVYLARAQRMKSGVHSGGGVPFFCRVEGAKKGKKIGGGGRLVFKEGALTDMADVVYLKESGLSLEAVGNAGLYERINKWYKIPADRRNAASVIYRLYWFYKAWEDAGKPDINTFRIRDLVRAYQEKTGHVRHRKPKGNPPPTEG